MEIVLSYFGVMIEAVVGFLAFEVIAISFIFSRKSSWLLIDSYRLFSLIWFNLASLIGAVVPFFVQIIINAENADLIFFENITLINLIFVYLQLTINLIVFFKFFRDLKKDETDKSIKEFNFKHVMMQQLFVYGFTVIVTIIFILGWYNISVLKFLTYSSPWLGMFLSLQPFTEMIVYSKN